MSQKTAKSARAKGNLVEEIAAMMHSGPGLTVETKVMLAPHTGPILSQKTLRKREIDVLVTASVSGYSVQIAIECKNERKPIGAPYIDAFVGKLQYVGIPTKHGVFISTSEYTSGAVERAQAAGVKLLSLTGLTEDRLNQAILGAVQTVVHLVLEVQEVNLVNSNPGPSSSTGDQSDNLHLYPFAFFDEMHNFKGTLFDLVWRMWQHHKLSKTIGEYEVDIEIPEGWYQYIRQDDGYIQDPVLSLRAKVRVTGLIVTLKGTATNNSLIDNEDKQATKSHVNVDFLPAFLPQEGLDEQAPAVALKLVYTEADLKAHLDEQNQGFLVRLVIGRLLLPRIRVFSRFGGLFWPPSEKAIIKMQELTDKYGSTGEVEEAVVNSDPFGELFIGSVWNPVWSGYSLA